MKKHNRLVALVLAIALFVPSVLAGCGKTKKEEVVIFSSAEDYRIEYVQKALNEKFPDYNIIIEYMSTSNIAAKIDTEEKATACDIIWSLEYGYLEQLSEKGLLADLSATDKSMYVQDTIRDNFVPDVRNGGAIILNTTVLNSKNLPEPTSYADLLKPEYKGLISMPSPKSSGTGYMFCALW